MFATLIQGCNNLNNEQGCQEDFWGPGQDLEMRPHKSAELRQVKVPKSFAKHTKRPGVLDS